MCVSFVVFQCVPFTTAFNAFADTTFWLIIGVLGIGVAIQSCGLLKRLSFYVLKLFPPTYNGIIAALLGVGTIFQPLMPSTSAKQSIVSPVAVSLGQTLGFGNKSREMAGLFNAMYIGWSVTGTVFISASFLGYLFAGNLPADVQAQFTWGRWFIAMIPWAIIVAVGNYFTLTKIYKPKTQNVITKDVINAQIKALGPMSRDEKITAVIMAITIIMWCLENTIGISACCTSLLCLVALYIFKIYSVQDFNGKMGWPLIFFVGAILNITSVMSSLGITNWLGGLIEPIIGGFVAQPYLFVLVLVPLIYLIRYLMVDFVTLTIVPTIILAPIAQSAGLSPWVVMMIFYCSVCIWVTKYQNANMLVGYAAFGGDDMLDYKHVMPGAYAHLVVNWIALLASIPYWQMLGYIA